MEFELVYIRRAKYLLRSGDVFQRQSARAFGFPFFSFSSREKNASEKENCFNDRLHFK